MKKQCKKVPSWRCKGFLSVALSSLTVVAFAQGAEVCTGTPYTIVSTVNASGASTYQWLENGLVLTGATAVTYTVPDNKPEGVYTYIRQAKSADCNEWQSSNEFTLTVFACSFTAGTETGATATFTDPRDGKKYKTVVMPDGRTWFAQNLNYTKDLTFNAYASEANGKMFTSGYGALAIGSYWCPGVSGSTYSGDQNACNIYGAIYTWQTIMMVDGKYADESRTNSAWDEAWVSPYYYNISGAPDTEPNADRNNARGGTTVKDGGRGICPLGWHIPTLREWVILLDKVEGDGNGNIFSSATVTTSWLGTDVGLKLKSASTYTGSDPRDGSWLDGSCNGQDTYGFKVLPNPGRIAFDTPGFGNSNSANWWNSSCTNKGDQVLVSVVRGDPGATLVSACQCSGRTVRCLKD
jgi:uncharacterized protein (TIGR02145 family)